MRESFKITDFIQEHGPKNGSVTLTVISRQPDMRDKKQTVTFYETPFGLTAKDLVGKTLTIEIS